MRVCWIAIFASAFTALAADAQDSNEQTAIRSVTVHAGDDLPISVQTLPDTVAGCYLITPLEELIQFSPVDLSSDKYELNQPNTLSGCRVTIKSINEKDTGHWQLYYTVEDEEGNFNIRSSQNYSVTVLPKDAQDQDSNEQTPEQTAIRSVTVHAGDNLPLSVETMPDTVAGCYLITPIEELIQFLPVDLSSDKYELNQPNTLSGCHVTVKSINEKDNGNWQLYYTVEDDDGNFNIRNSKNYSVTVLPKEPEDSNEQTAIQSVTVHAGDDLPISVQTLPDTVAGCYLITPLEELIQFSPVDLSSDKYELNQPNTLSGCRVTIKSINEKDNGNWQLYYTVEDDDGNFNIRSSQNYSVTVLPKAPEDSNEQTAIRSVTVHAGDDLPISVQTLPHTVAGCYLITPLEELIQFLPVDLSSDKYELNQPNTLSGCRVTIKSINEKDNGNWQLYYTVEDDDGNFNIRSSQNYSVTVLPKDSNNDLSSIEDESEEDDGITLLPTIHYGARKDINISITLSKQLYDEECYLQTPQGLIVKLEDAQIDGIQVFPKSSNFVSCRIVIGPMESSLLGTWMLCGKHLEGNNVHERCQPGDVAWTGNNPSARWSSITRPNFDHVVHYGFQLAPIVRGTGTVDTCHVVTPAGEDIAVTPESDYPSFKRVVTRDASVCSISIRVRDANDLGNWVLYGTFRSLLMDYNVVSLPMTFFLYDQENPYNQAYNVTQLDTQTHVISKGHTIMVEVVGTGARDECKFINNNGDSYDETTIRTLQGVTFVDNDMPTCRLQIGPVTKDMFGKWRLIGKFSRDNSLFNEFQLPFNIIEEDPANPHTDDVERTIQYFDSQDVYAELGSSYVFSTATGTRVVTDSCHVRTPDNMQYILRPGEVQPTFETVELPTISCGVRVHVDSEDAIGEWLLIARLTVNGSPVEQRLPFSIRVEEKVTAVPNVTTIAEGNDLYVRLEAPTPLFPTCSLTGPVRNNADHDEKYVESCGFIVRDVTVADAGTWEILYGNKIKYRAEIQVNVTERFGLLISSVLTWSKDSSINETIGPDDAVYCRVEDPSGTTVLETLGPCNIAVARASPEHEGVWKATIGTSGRILTDTLEFEVKISPTASKSKVITSVVSEKPSVMLSCQVESDHEVTTCKFRDPSGKVLLASQGVGEDRYSFHGVGVRLQSNVTSRECGLRITNPVVEDLGLWRCVVETEVETYYGFLTVLCPWAMRDPNVAAAVVTEPTLTAVTPTIRAVEEDAVTMRCSVQSAIRYCYFRARNGTVYNVGPGTSDWFSYAGAGLDAGECSIRFPSLHAEDSGAWSCHVGFLKNVDPEQRAAIQVEIEAQMSAKQFHVPGRLDTSTMVISGQVHRRRAVEYCRFVRIDGRGFTSEHIPFDYEDHSVLANGKCEIRIRNPSILELHPWTVVARIVGQNAELSRSTEHLLQTVDEPRRAESNFMMVWSAVLVISLALFLAGLLLGPKRNREWTYRRSAFVRHSFRQSFMKKPLCGTPVNTREHTPTVA